MRHNKAVLQKYEQSLLGGSRVHAALAYACTASGCAGASVCASCSARKQAWIPQMAAWASRGGVKWCAVLPADSYVDDNKRVKWCPSAPHCGNAVRTNKEPFCEVGAQ